MSQLFESEICVQIGDRHFQIPRDIFSGPGDSPNFFSLGFAVFFASPSEVFPGLDRNGLLRPPAIVPPSVANRSGDVFAELLHLLRGYPLHIRNEDHRAELLRDCRYFHLRGLEQKLIPHQISHNPIRNRSEIVICLEDVRQSGVHVARGTHPPSDARSLSGGWIQYARPFVDENPSDLVIEVGGESTFVDVHAMRAELVGLAKARLASLAQVVATKMNLNLNRSEGETLLGVGAEGAKIHFASETDLRVDGESRTLESLRRLLPQPALEPSAPPAKRKRSDSESGDETARCIVRTGQWRLRVQSSDGVAHNNNGLELVLVAVKLDLYTHPRRRNQARPFLS